MDHRPAHSHLSAQRRRRRPASGAVQAAGVLVAAALTGGLLAASPAPATADTLTPGAAAMPAALAPGTFTGPVFPLRSVPGYAVPSSVHARVRPLDGGADKRFMVPTPPGSTLLWGDWNGDGAHTPAVVTNGHWVVYDSMLGTAPAFTREFDFGMVGDRYVAGDWNRDGRTDVGVVRGNQWLLRDAPDAGPTWRRVAFGAATDVPVTGDWNGDGRDGIGVRRGARFYLRDLTTPGPATYHYAFGRPSDIPVTGDWDGDGTDAVGVVRGDVWHLRSASTPPVQAAPAGKPVSKADQRAAAKAARPTVTKRVITRPRELGAVPAPWPTPAGPTGAACPTASSGVAVRPQVGATVKPSLILDKLLPYDTLNPAVGSDPVFQVRAALLESERFLLGAQYLERWYDKRGQRYTDILARFEPAAQEYAVRRPAMAALATAVAARTSAHSDAVVGRTRDEAIRYADWLVRSIACEHLAVSPGGWGAGWQTAHWAMLTGQAAWLVWDQLTPQTREYVAQMLVYEADLRTTRPVEYWADASGTVVTRGDTKAEENSWNAGVLELAIAMMPKHEQAANWRRRAVDLEVAAYARLADINSAQVVNGVTLADRLDGANTYDDGTVENHRAIHPDYMTNIQQSWWAADIAGLAGRFVPQSAFHNAALVYGAMSTVPFTPQTPSPTGVGVFGDPGGTIYRPGANDIYYPQGSIWGSVRRAHFVSFDAHAYAYGLDTSAAWSARDALAYHVTGQHLLLSNNGTGDGRTYNFDPPVANSQDSYNGREEYAASQIAAAWLALYVSRNAWDGAFNQPPINRATYAPLSPLTTAQTGWLGWSARSGGSDSSHGQRRSP